MILATGKVANKELHIILSKKTKADIIYAVVNSSANIFMDKSFIRIKRLRFVKI